MTADTTWRIPPSVLRHLAELPQDRPIVLLLRHSVRYDLPVDAPGNEVPLTEVGRVLAHDLGTIIGPHLKSLNSSPIARCVETAVAVGNGAGSGLTVRRDRLLGDPGVFVLDSSRAWENWQKLGHEGVIAELVSGNNVLPGMADPHFAARFLVHHALAQAGENAGIHIFVSHDSLIAATVARLTGRFQTPNDWPSYLEGAFFTRTEDGMVRCIYRDCDQCVPSTLCLLDEKDVTAFMEPDALPHSRSDAD